MVNMDKAIQMILMEIGIVSNLTMNKKIRGAMGCVFQTAMF
jgi:hypothetical protein